MGNGCYWPGDMAVRMRKILARPWVGARVCHLLLLLLIKFVNLVVPSPCVTEPYNNYLYHDMKFSRLVNFANFAI